MNCAEWKTRGSAGGWRNDSKYPENEYLHKRRQKDMKWNTTLFAIALIAVIASAGNAAAFGEPVFGTLDTTAASGDIVVLWVEDDRTTNPDRNRTTMIGDPYLGLAGDQYYFMDIEPLLKAHGKNIGDLFTITVALLCDDPDTNTYHNDTGVTQTETYGIAGATVMPMMRIEPCANIDLNVTEIVLNPDNYHATDSPRLYVNEVNTINATVWNYGTTAAGAFDVCFKDDLNAIDMDTVDVPGGLAAGTSITVTATWTPTCADYPVMPGFPPQSLPITVNVTADCNSAVTESDEGNNTLLKHVPAVTPYFASGQWADMITGVVNNGYKSKNFDCDPAEDPLTQFKYYDLIGGGVEYNVSGESFDLQPTSDPVNNTVDRTHNIALPAGATVLDARLYLYSSINHGAWIDYVGGATSDLEVNFNSAGYQAPDKVYYDGKGFGRYLMNKQTAAFDVTSVVSGSGTYQATVKNIDPNNSTTLYGEMLVVVYQGAIGGDEVEIWMLEGSDWLRSDKTTSKYSVSVAEATATVGFAGTINPSLVGSACLMTVTNCAGMGGGAPGANLLFNGNTIKEDAWYEGEAYPGSGVFIEKTYLSRTALLTTGNTVGFEDEDKHGLVIHDAILVMTKTDEGAVCLGTCYDKTDCEGNVTAEDITCNECIGVAGGLSWSNYEFDSPCCGGQIVPRRCYNYCPQCCDGIDNDVDGTTDWPTDLQCACCLDETEDFDEGCPAPCVPELATFTLVGIGLMMFAGVVHRRKE